jgi:hypothetical protein
MLLSSSLAFKYLLLDGIKLVRPSRVGRCRSDWAKAARTQGPAKHKSSLCKNCVRWPRNRRRTSRFTGSHRGVSWRRKSLNRVRYDVSWCRSVSIAKIAFQACSFNHSDISPSLESTTYGSDSSEKTANCVTPPNVPLSLTAVSSIATALRRLRDSDRRTASVTSANTLRMKLPLDRGWRSIAFLLSDRREHARPAALGEGLSGPGTTGSGFRE